jgi:hypothetical protein
VFTLDISVQDSSGATIHLVWISEVGDSKDDPLTILKAHGYGRRVFRLLFKTSASYFP